VVPHGVVPHGVVPHDRRIDLRAIARERLLAAGAHAITDVPACTICDERFFSHRREGPRAGRQAALAWLA
jgi:copper oxidase (laccase) domain-containing protein